MINEKFGMLTVVSEAGRDKHGQQKLICVCDCGVEKTVLRGNLLKGNSTSCGCKRRKTCADRMKGLNARHLQTGTKLWNAWKGIVERTTSPTSEHFPRYGAVGIGIFDDWLVYENFAAYLGQPPTPQHSVDRIDGAKGYIPGNVRWATAREQAGNRRTNVFVTVEGAPMLLVDAAKRLGISKSTASRWVQNGKLEKHEQPTQQS